MSRNYVSKMLVGDGIANLSGASIALAALTEGKIIAFDFDKANDAVTSISATTTLVGFARGTSVLGEPVLAGPIPIAGISSVVNNPFEGVRNKKVTLTVTAAPTEVGKGVVLKVIYHDNLSIIPNQIKSTIISVMTTTANTTSVASWAAAIAAEFNLQKSELGGNLFVTVTAAAAVVTFEGITLLTQSKYNHIDRPEAVNFEVGAPMGEVEAGVYTVATTVSLRHGQGDSSKIAWMEEQHMGRLGYADRRMWNDTKKYESQLTATTEYEVLVVQGDQYSEGDMQGTMANPIGAVVASGATGMALLEVDLAVGGVVPVVVAAS